MRKQDYKGRCEKRQLSKCEGIFKSYDKLTKGSLLFVDGNTLELMRYSEGFANKLFEL